MKKLKDLIKSINPKKIIGSVDVFVEKISQNSNSTKEGFLFAALLGRSVDGHKFIQEAIKSGAKSILCQSLPHELKEGITYLLVENSREALGFLVHEFYDKPSLSLKLIGVTGTNGKTSTATLLYELFNRLEEKSGLISTVFIKTPSKEMNSLHTTPYVIELNEYLSQMVKEGCKYVFMEVSSHGIDQGRISGLSFFGAIFTNITHDHLDYHGDFKTYLYTKKILFDQLSKKSFALVNKDDKNSEVILQNTSAKKYSYSLKNKADFKAKILEKDLFGMRLLIDGKEIWSRLIGTFNAVNLLAVYSMAKLIGKDSFEILTSLSDLKPPKGRFEQYLSENDLHLIVDYAHTPDALEKVLDTLIEVKFKESRLICLIGCGGDRDKEKRAFMGEIALKKSDLCVFTSDNPRSEDPNEIINQMQQRLTPLEKKRVHCIVDRREAIEAAIKLASPKDIILLAGKGHEYSQEIKGVRYPFEDMQVAKSILSSSKQ